MENTHAPQVQRSQGVAYLLCGFGYLCYFLFLVGFLVLALPTSFLLIPFKKQKPFLHTSLQKALYLFMYHFLHYLGVASIKKPRGVDNVPSGGAILVANHQSWLDGPLLLGLLPKTTPLMKASYARNLFYRQFVRWIAFISIESGSQESAKQALEKGEEKLAQGERLLIFPEGSRSTTGRLLPFKPFAFKLATTTNMPIVPITIELNTPFMTKTFASFFPRERVIFTIVFHPPIMPHPEERTEQLLARVEKMMHKSIS